MGSFLSKAERNCFIAGKRRLENLKSRWNKIRGSCISNIALAMANSVPQCFFESPLLDGHKCFDTCGTFSSLALDKGQNMNTKTQAKTNQANKAVAKCRFKTLAKEVFFSFIAHMKVS